MYRNFEQKIAEFMRSAPPELFNENQIGLEKESLRVASHGGIAQTPHSPKLGSALTHPFITTDYSEALLEFVTPPHTNKSELLNFLRDVQTFVYSQLPEDEILWASSMPCVLAGEKSIPIAEYGASNLGQMKTVYRRGLGHRYGRLMQVIAGVHFNFSLSPLFWRYLQDVEQSNEDSKTFIANSYFKLIRNIQRFGWLIPYLFGSSPTVCRSFLNGKATDMELFDESTYYYPFATSLRMGDIGYQNRKEDRSGIQINYDSLTKYVESLRRAITTAHPEFQKLGIKFDGRYEQLNTNLLQIENEYYSSIRPKQIANAFEMPIKALLERGVAYVELRSLDLNVFQPEGICDNTIYFLEAFALFCLLHESPHLTQDEYRCISKNMLDVAHHGRSPRLMLKTCEKDRSIKSWGTELLTLMESVCELLDNHGGGSHYSSALIQFRSYIDDPDCTPSARVISEMRKHNEGFFHFSLRKSQEHAAYFKRQQLSESRRNDFLRLSNESLEQQKLIEANDTLSFEEFLDHYFKQTLQNQVSHGM